jgi:hypothetical protein
LSIFGRPDNRVADLHAVLLEVVPLNSDSSPSVDSEGAIRGRDSTKDDVAKVGGASGIGAIIGVIAGGGKGAAIGSIIGAGAGTGRSHDPAWSRAPARTGPTNEDSYLKVRRAVSEKNHQVFEDSQTGSTVKSSPCFLFLARLL